jgi:Ca2+-binding EF-hand superfamily protein
VHDFVTILLMHKLTHSYAFFADIFAFDLYDKNADGVLEAKEVHQMFKELLGSKMFETDYNQA